MADNIFKNGRWTSKCEDDKCEDLKDTEQISHFEKFELWLLDVVMGKLVGTSNEFEGWTYYA